MKLKGIRFGILIFSVLAFMAFSLSVYAEERDSWTYGGVTYRLPVPRDQVVIPKDIPEYHVVVKGDTLWDIAGKYLGNNFFWPLIWEVNMDHIPNPHLIFPGQKVYLPKATVPAGKGKEVAKAEEKEKEVELPKKFPIASYSDMVKSGYIADEKISGPQIIGSELSIYDMSKGDIVFINVGKNSNYEAGKKYYVARNTKKIIHPVTKKKLGYLVNILGILKILCQNENTSVAVIEKSFAAINPGDYIIPFEEYAIPEMEYKEPEARDPCVALNPPSDVKGYIVSNMYGDETYEEAVILGKNSIVYLDVGSEMGVVPGDTFYIFSKNLNIKKQYVGELIVLKTRPKTATAVISRSFYPIFIGDMIELKK